MNKDREVDEIFGNFVKNNEYQISRYIDNMRKQMNVILSITDENIFNLRKDEIKDLILEFSTSFSCINYRITSAAKDIGIDVDFSGTAIGLKISLPERHDFCVCLARAFSWDTFNNFFIPWVKEAAVFVNSNGRCYPRFMRAVQMSSNIPYFFNYILVTRDDINYDYDYILTNIKLPGYYPFYNDNIPSIDKFEAVYRKCLKSWKEPFEKFKKGEYALYSYIKNYLYKLNQGPVFLA